MTEQRINSLRNIAIIAHVDHGKTTLVDALLKQTDVFRDNQTITDCMMDSNDLERERGITIFSKNASITYRDVKVNIIDTPGHADFGGEVERVLNMADGALLLVDAYEGPMPQTRFVLTKALSVGLKVLVVINKIDRPDARPEAVVDEVFDLFCQLDANDEQLDFQVIYAAGRDGYAKRELDDPSTDCRPLLDAVIEHVPPPLVDRDGPFQMQVANLEYSEYVGRISIGRILRGEVREKMPLALLKQDGKIIQTRVERIDIFSGLSRQQTDKAGAGEIVLLTGIQGVDIYDTLTDVEHPEPLAVVAIDEPTLTMEFRANDSPFSGLEGEYVTTRHVANRLKKEMLSNIALRVEEKGDCFHVSGRGLMHLGILIENMRREGFEFAVGRPHVIFKKIDGKQHEPIELLSIDVPEALSGKAMELVGARRGVLDNMTTRGDLAHLEFEIPARGLIGLRSRLLNATRGEAVMHHIFLKYEPHKGEVPSRLTGVLVSSDRGPSTPYAIDSLQQRGIFFIPPGTPVYPGMIVGEYARNTDLEVNICKAKKMTNVRSAGSDKGLDIAPPRAMSLEACLEYLEEDELLEVTPKNLRMRKRVLDKNIRERLVRQRRKVEATQTKNS